MHHFFVQPSQIRDNTVCIEGGDVNHIKNVLRMSVGEQMSVCSGQDDTVYLCRITSVEKDKIMAAIEQMETQSRELPAKIFLFQGLPKSDKMEWIVQKAVELGVYEIIPVSTKRTVVKLDAKKEKAKCARWQAIAEGAAKQSGRTVIPSVRQPVSFAEALRLASEMELKVIPYELSEGMEKTREIFGSADAGQNIAVLIGPEGGFEEDEVRRAQEAGFLAVTLGRRILRTETAGLAALAMLGYLLEA